VQGVKHPVVGFGAFPLLSKRFRTRLLQGGFALLLDRLSQPNAMADCFERSMELLPIYFWDEKGSVLDY